MPNSLTFKQLTYFVALAETRHYRKAADRIGISQPSLSQQIVGLEASLGVDLVERGRRGAVLTPCGREVLVQAKKILEETSVLRTLVETTRKGTSGTIRLGSSPTIGPYFMPYVLRQLEQSHPSLNVVLQEAAPMVLQDELFEGKHDLLLTQLPIRSADFEVKRLFREPLQLALSRAHPLAGLSVADDLDLKGQNILTLSRSYLLHDQTVALSQEVGARLRQDYEGTSLDALRRMTALNMGVTFLPSLYVHSEISSKSGDVVVLPVRKNRFTRSIGLAWRRNSLHSEVIESVAVVFREVASERFKGLVTVEA